MVLATICRYCIHRNEFFCIKKRIPVLLTDFCEDDFDRGEDE